MNTEILFIYNSSYWEHFKPVKKFFINVNRIFFRTFNIIRFFTLEFEIIFRGHVFTLMISSEKMNTVGIFNFEYHEKGQNLDAELTSIDKISQKQKIVVFDWVSLQNVQEIKKLSVNIAYNNKWRSK